MSPRRTPGRHLIEHCCPNRPDLIITDIKMPDMDGLRAAEEINRDGPVPVILVTGHHDADLLARASDDYIMAYLSKPAKPVDLQAAIQMAMLRFGHLQLLRQEASTLRQALEDRKVVERAKGVVMKRLGLEEGEAFTRLRKLSSTLNRKLVDLGQSIIKADEIYQIMEGR